MEAIGAVERSVNVNAGAYGEQPQEPEEFAYADDTDMAADSSSDDSPKHLGWVDAPKPPQLSPPLQPGDAGMSRTPRGPSGAPAGADQGPCLYLGPAGQRCDRRAIASGYCSKHQLASLPGLQPSLSIPQISKRALGAAGILAVLWPILFDFIRELLRLFR